MAFHLTRQEIRLLCGRLAYEKGEAYVRERKVGLTHIDHDYGVYEAVVSGREDFAVSIEFAQDRSMDASCTCPSLSSYDHHCQHIAAVLIHLHERMEHGTLLRPYLSTTTVQDGRDGLRQHAAKSMLDLFQGPGKDESARQIGRVRFDTRETLEVEFTVRPYPYGYRQILFGIEMRLGGKRLYIVQKMREFLSRIARKEAFVFSKHFTFEPLEHCFERENEEVIQLLLEMYQHEAMYREAINNGSQIAYASTRNAERILLIPPVFWERMLSALQKAPLVKWMQGDQEYQGIELAEGNLPLSFSFKQDEDGRELEYQMSVKGLDSLTILEAYGMAQYEGVLYKLGSEPCKRLFKLKQIMEKANTESIVIEPEQLSPFIEQVVPGLMKLGEVRIAPAISDRIVKAPLQAKLYLDRIRDRLLAGLEFHYGQVMINPLEEKEPTHPHFQILIRDVEKEDQILEIMQNSLFTQTEAGYFLENEEAEYHFLYHVVPKLEKLVQVYATSAVKTRLHPGQVGAKVKVELKERTNWLDVQFEFAGIPESEIRQLLHSVEEKRRYYRLPNGSLLPLEGEEFQEIGRFLDAMNIRQADLKGSEVRLPLIRGMRFLDADQQGRTVQLGKSFRKLLENMRNPDNLDFPLPDSLQHVLRDYQRYGFQWMKTLAHYGFGGILADDMGLGKTLQSIAFLVSVLPQIREQKLPALIVAPASVVYNWYHELRKFAPQVKAVVADGTKEERDQRYREMEEVDVFITSYPLVRRDHDHFAKVRFHSLILDEAQAFKNHATQTAHAVKQIQAEHRFALTGTPIENRLEELWSIYDAVFPALFPSRKAFNELPSEVVAKRIKPFLLRRVKRDVLQELPEKIESIQTSDLLPEQKKLYLSYLVKLQQETLKHLQEKGFQKNRIKILAGLTRLRQLCCHPALFVEEYTGSSAKFEQLLDTLEECRQAGRRVLVFSQFTEMLGIIGRRLGELGIPYLYLDGQTPVRERVPLCQRFNEGEGDLFLISLKAGGTGLNLTGADTVILYDLWWNPAVEEQATDRAHRIGQKKIVQVIRLVTQGTVEEKMYDLQQKKKHLIDEVIQPGEEALSALTEQEIREILLLE